MYKDGVLNLIPILYLIVPIVLGLILGFIFKKVKSYKTISKLIVSIILSGVYLTIISFYTSSKNETELFIILFMWNSILIFISSIIFYYVYKKVNTKY